MADSCTQDLAREVHKRMVEHSGEDFNLGYEQGARDATEAILGVYHHYNLAHDREGCGPCKLQDEKCNRDAALWWFTNEAPEGQPPPPWIEPRATKSERLNRIIRDYMDTVPTTPNYL